MSHSCFIHSPTDGHSGCFCILATVNTAAINKVAFMFFPISVLGFFRYISRSGVTGSKADPILVFWGISTLLPTVAVPVCIPTNNAKCSPFSTSLPARVVAWFIQLFEWAQEEQIDESLKTLWIESYNRGLFALHCPFHLCEDSVSSFLELAGVSPVDWEDVHWSISYSLPHLGYSKLHPSCCSGPEPYRCLY